MGTELKADWADIDLMLANMRQIGRQSDDLTSYFAEKVCSGSGFDYPGCALKPIGDQLPKLAGLFEDARDVFSERWTGLQTGIFETAQGLDAADQNAGEAMQTFLAAQISPFVTMFGAEEEGLADLDDLDTVLRDPEKGEAQFDHNEKFEVAAKTWDTARDIINAGVDGINKIAHVGLPKLDERSLAEFVVYPLAANYAKIGANADACTVYAGGMDVWSGNFLSVAGRVDAALEGHAGTALKLQLDVYALVARAIGACVRSGQVVYVAIAAMSEKIAIKVEDMLVVVGQKLAKLSAKISSKFAGPLGWALLAVDIAEKGIGVITDIIDDVTECKKLIDYCFDMVHDIGAWAQVQADRLDEFRQVLDLVAQLPGTGSGGPLAFTSDGLAATQSKINEIGFDFQEKESPELDTLDDTLDELGQTTAEAAGAEEADEAEESDDENDEPDDDEVIMAPGPFGEPGVGSSVPATTA